MLKLPQVFLTTPFAHRAYHNKAEGRPENSIAAVKAAIAAGYGIEIDVQPSSDNQAIVFHDYDLGRLTAQTGPVREQTAHQLSQIGLLEGQGTIPTLPELLSVVAGRVPILIEIKDQDRKMGSNVGMLEQAVADAIHEYKGPLAVMSFNPHSVSKMQEFAPMVPRGLTTCAFDDDDSGELSEEMRRGLRDIREYDRTGSCFISHDASDLDRERVALLKANGAGILCWTIRSRAEETAARKFADNITFEGYAASLQA